jgi:superfamily II DNA/RNA helicase
LSQKVIDTLSEKGIVRFTPVQGEAFDPVVAGRDVIGRSRTGTGKTLAFGLPCMTRLNNQWFEKKGLRDERGQMKRGRPVSMVVLCPTRELARQVNDELAAAARPLGINAEVFHGGVSYDPQVCVFSFRLSNCLSDAQLTIRFLVYSLVLCVRVWTFLLEHLDASLIISNAAIFV